MTTTHFVLAADVGGSHITAALVDMKARRIIQPSLIRTHVNAAGTAKEIMAAWSNCLLAAKGETVVSKICLAMPGPFNYEEGISLMQGQGKYDSLYHRNVRVLLSEAMKTGAEDFFFENDAACFLQGEVFAGCAQGLEKVIGVTLGTGLGTAVYQNGFSHSADLWGLPFGDGVAEDKLSTRWFLQQYEAVSGHCISGVKELAQRAGSDGDVLTLFREFGKNLSLFLQIFIEREKPEAVVIAGNIAKAYHLFQHETEQPLMQQFPAIQIKKSALGEDAALLGAAGSWHSQLQKQLALS